jgi:predicted nucleic acid-binding protein
MEKKTFYFDTSIWRDYYESREDRLRPLGEWAFMLIRQIIEEGSIVLYSDLVIKELAIKYSNEEIDNILLPLKGIDLLVKVSVYSNQKKEASKVSNELNIPFCDVLHAILARDNNAIMVTRDKHFVELFQIVEVMKPEDLI